MHAAMLQPFTGSLYGTGTQIVACAREAAQGFLEAQRLKSSLYFA
jgi:hypothetical protein